MKTKSTLRPLLALAGSSILTITSAHAAIRNWDGDTSATWGTAGNWDTAPANSTATDIANFNLATYGGNPVYAPNAGTTSINGITIGASNGAMTLTTTNLTIGGSGITIANGAGALNVSGTITVGATQNWTNNDNDTATFGAIAGNNALTLAGGNFRFNGVNTGTKNININSGTLEIGTAGKLYSPSFTTVPTVTVGTGAKLIVNSWVYDQAGSLGTLDYGRDRLVVNGGIIEVVGNSTASGRIFTVGTGGATLRSSVNSGQTWTLSLDANPLYKDIQVNSGRTLTLDGTGNGVIENTIVNTSGTGNITKAGAGTWTLSAANTYSGTTTVSAGTLLVNNTTGSGTGSSVVSVSAGTVANTPVAKLGGTGTIGGNVSLAAESTTGHNNGGVLAPTAGLSGVTKLSITGTTSFGAGSTFEWNMSATSPATDPGDGTANSGSYGQVVATGAVSGGTAIFKIVLGAGNAFTDAFWGSGKTWTNLFTGAGAPTNLTSIFSSISGTDLTWNSGTGRAVASTGGYFTLSGSSLNWTAIPEPTSALGGLLLTAGLLGRRRKAEGETQDFKTQQVKTEDR